MPTRGPCVEALDFPLAVRPANTDIAPPEFPHELPWVNVATLHMRKQLGRPVRAFSYVKGSEAHYKPVHLSLVRQAGYDVAFTAVSGANSGSTDPLQLRRYNIEPYPPRTFELVLAGACDLISLKDTVSGTHARRLFNAALGTSTK